MTVRSDVIRWTIYAAERPEKKLVVQALTIGDALDACKKLLGPTKRPCAIDKAAERELKPLLDVLRR